MESQFIRDIAIAIIGSFSTVFGVWLNYVLSIKREKLIRKKPDSSAIENSSPFPEFDPNIIKKGNPEVGSELTKPLHQTDNHPVAEDQDGYLILKIPIMWWQPKPWATIKAISLGILFFLALKDFVGLMGLSMTVHLIYWIIYIPIGIFLISPSIFLARKHLKNHKIFVVTVFVISSPIVYWLAVSIRIDKLVTFPSDYYHFGGSFVSVVVSISGIIIGMAYIRFTEIDK